MIEKVQTMKNQRETLVNDLRKKIQGDDITKFVLMRRQENYKVRERSILAAYHDALSLSEFVRRSIEEA